jgi:glycosyltransferase involved in cell wall biosynthesis
MRTDLPFISCKCITYGRVDLLEEALHSFLIQEYEGPKELVIVNDYPLQTLKYEHPDVRIINLTETFETIGAKENFAVQNCKADIIAVWDDDDVAMPNHLSNIAKYFEPGSDLLHWQNGVYYNEPDSIALTALGNSGIVYSRKIWQEIGGHPLENAGYDMSLVLAIKRVSSAVVIASPPDDEVSWFYMWGGRGYHMSGQGTDTADRPNVIKRHSDHIEGLRREGKIQTGEVQLVPAWRNDYRQMLENFNLAQKASS